MRRVLLVPLVGLLWSAPRSAAQDTLFIATDQGRTQLQLLSNGNLGIATGSPDRRLVVDSVGSPSTEPVASSRGVRSGREPSPPAGSGRA